MRWLDRAQYREASGKLWMHMLSGCTWDRFRGTLELQNREGRDVGDRVEDNNQKV